MSEVVDIIKVSIIVPVYNVEKYLSRCIESILNQTLKDIELILVNDGSTDKCKDICKEYSKYDSRVKFINKINEGVSSARNVGIDNSSGDYISFVDPDDYLDNDAIEYLYRLIKKYNADVSCYKMKTYRNNEYHIIEENEEVRLYINESIVKNQIESGKFLFSSCNKLYSRKLFDGVNDRFNNDIRYAEDALFNIHMLSKCKKLVYSNLRKYNYFINEGSTVNKISDKRIDILKAQRQMLEFINNKYCNYTQNIIKQYVNSSILIIVDIAKSKELFKNLSILKRLKNQIKKDKYVINNFNNIDRATKFKFYSMKISPIILLILYKIRYITVINSKRGLQ